MTDHEIMLYAPLACLVAGGLLVFFWSVRGSFKEL